jgi:16S rRNA U516 pseudouridylate synthase RsuA-like enzyme
MPKRKRKLTAAQKAEKKRRKQEYRMVFIGGRQKRVRRPPQIDGMPVEEFIRRNADPIWLHESGYWDLLESEDGGGDKERGVEDLPF